MKCCGLIACLMVLMSLTVSPLGCAKSGGPQIRAEEPLIGPGEDPPLEDADEGVAVAAAAAGEAEPRREIEPVHQALFEQWRTARQSGGKRRGQTITHLDRSYIAQDPYAGETHPEARRVVVDEEVTDGDSCHTNQLVLILDPLADPKVFEEREFGGQCCPGTTCTPTMLGWLLNYRDIRRHSNDEALRELIDPEEGLKITIGLEDPDDIEVGPWVIERDMPDNELSYEWWNYLEFLDFTHLFTKYSCKEKGDNHHFTCTYDLAGLFGMYTWKIDGDQVYLLSITEIAH